MDRKAMAENLKALRKKSGKTQAEMAEIINVSMSSYSQYEAGLKVPRDDVKVRIAEYFNKTVQSIFFG